jgi:hypothetical protein
MPMNPRLLRPRSTVHPEAADWANRVRANGGSVSGSTLTAVSKFCASIAAAGIRDRFYRLNLFCGTGLPACLVPLYRGQSLGGTQFGNATDTNNGPFVSGDYTETGASGGLAGNGSSKFLNTGLAPNALPSLATGHLSAYIPTVTAGSIARMVAAADASNVFSIQHRLISANNESYAQGCWGSAAFAVAGQGAGSTTISGGLWTATRTAATTQTLYQNATSRGTDSTSVTPASHANAWYVFAGNTSGAAGSYCNHRMMAYSIGASMSATQVSAYNSAMQAFQTALGRNA